SSRLWPRRRRGRPRRAPRRPRPAGAVRRRGRGRGSRSVPRDSSVAPSTFGGTHSATLRDDSEDVPSTVDNFVAATGGGQWSAAGRWRRGVVRHRPAADGWATPAGGGAGVALAVRLRGGRAGPLSQERLGEFGVSRTQVSSIAEANSLTPV